MKLTIALAWLGAVAVSTSAQPIDGRDDSIAVSQMVAGSLWTVQNFKRVCNNADTSCVFTYGINKNDGNKITSCNYTVSGSPASHTSYNNVACGKFIIGSGWDSQGFTVLSMVTNGNIIYPGYTDAELSTGKVVKPNKSFTPQKLP